jgi:hypothetical protein
VEDRVLLEDKVPFFKELSTNMSLEVVNRIGAKYKYDVSIYKSQVIGLRNKPNIDL